MPSNQARRNFSLIFTGLPAEAAIDCEAAQLRGMTAREYAVCKQKREREVTNLKLQAQGGDQYSNQFIVVGNQNAINTRETNISDKDEPVARYYGTDAVASRY